MPKIRVQLPFARRGLSLIEILICIGIIAMLLSIALPIGLRTIEEGEVASAEEEVASELLKARVQAQEGRRPVEVVFEGDPPRLVVRWFDPALFGADGEEAADEADSTADGRRETELASSFRVIPMTDVEAEMGLPAADVEPRPAASDSLRVAVFLPDGTLLFAAPFLLLHDNGMRSSISVDPWTGHPEVARKNVEAGGETADAAAAEAEGFPRIDGGERPEFDRPSEAPRNRGGARGSR
jgi:prepilin-type N-terminal cleavage/methylation domain-containing protein